MKYKPGLHIICDIDEVNASILSDMDSFKNLIHGLIHQHQLSATGEVFHAFENGGYTAVIGLTESHLSVHTWPEFGKLTFDIFLSNFMQVNDGICENIALEIQSFFSGKVSQIHRIQR